MGNRDGVRPQTTSFYLFLNTFKSIQFNQLVPSVHPIHEPRCRIEILRDVLAVLLHEKTAKKTKLMQKSNLSHISSRKYFAYLLENEFIVCESGVYTLSDKGMELLDRINRVCEMLDR